LDDLLFLVMLLAGFRGLLRLGEMTVHDRPQMRQPGKYVRRLSLEWVAEGFAFWLNSHKTDRSFEGARILIPHHDSIPAPYFMDLYLARRDALFPINPYLFVTSSGAVPTRSWFLTRLRTIVPSRGFAGQSLRSGGATFLAEIGTPTHLIQANGRWSSDAFQIYIRKHPVVLQACLAARARRLA
jgi:hypothetical protein